MLVCVFSDVSKIAGARLMPVDTIEVIASIFAMDASRHSNISRGQLESVGKEYIIAIRSVPPESGI